jgi:hypothetical protein
MSYVEQAEGKYFDELLEQEEFQQDLKDFFSGGRYNYSPEQLEDTEQLADDFAQHMRWQSTNEATAVFDLLYVQKPDEEVSRDGKVAFGKLMQAYDVSEGGGTGLAEGAWDYTSAFFAAPSTAVTAATFGFGVGSKIAAKATAKTSQMAVRAYANKLLNEGLTKQAVKEKVKKSVTKEAGKAAAISFAGEAAVGGVSAYATGETREEVIPGYDYTIGDLAVDATIDGTLGAVVGGFGSAWTQSTRNKAADALVDQAKKASDQAKVNAKLALDVITKSKLPNDQINDTMSDVADLAQMFRAREAGKTLDPLDKDAVQEGQMLFNRMLDERANELIAPGLDMNTVRGIAAASIKLKEKLKLRPGERISSAVAEGISTGAIQVDEITEIRRQFNLSAEEMSYLWLAELSKAGKVLAEGSKIKKAMTTQLDVLASKGASVFTGNEADEILGRLERGGAYRILQDLDQTRIAFMTSQVGTTAANVATGGYNIVADMSDSFWKDVLNSTMGTKMPDGTVQRKWTGGTLSTLKAFTLNRTESEILGSMLLDDAPMKFTELFYETQRVGDLTQSKNFLHRSARFVNTLNMATDAVFKQGSFYGAFDRRLRELNDPALGKNFKEYLQKHTDLEAARNAGVVDYATDYAKRFTFQRGYEGDKSLFGQGAQAVQQAHRKLPFVISEGMGIPFPRYVANHLEYVNDYTPIGILTGGLDALEKSKYGNKIPEDAFSDPFKTGRDRVARQMTGAMMTMGGVWIAAEKNGTIDYDKLVTATGSETDVGRTAGPWAANLLIGDLIWRSGILGKLGLVEGNEPLPINKEAFTGNVSEVLAGMGDLGFNGLVIQEFGKSLADGKFTDGALKSIGNIVSTFTYPATISRDVAAQMSDFARGNPYVRDVRGTELTGEKNYLEQITGQGIFRNQAMRFLMDMKGVSLTQTRRGTEGEDLKLYSPFSPTPVGGYNPITRQFGYTQEPPSTELQKEMNILQLEEYKLYGNTKTKNSSVDYAVRKLLAVGMSGVPSMAEEFKAWKSSWQLNNRSEYAGRTYDELGDDKELKRMALEDFVNHRIANAQDLMTDAFNTMLESNTGRRQAAGFLRNQYVLKEAQLKSSKGRTFDDLVSIMTRGEGIEYKSARDYLGDSSSVEEELSRRRRIIQYAEENYDFSEGIYPEQFLGSAETYQ